MAEDKTLCRLRRRRAANRQLSMPAQHSGGDISDDTIGGAALDSYLASSDSNMAQEAAPQVRRLRL